MSRRQITLLVSFAVCAFLAILIQSEPMLGLVVGGFLSLGWQLRAG